jgi:hypothetical protein
MRAAIAGCDGLAKECFRISLISAPLYTVQLATSTAPWHDVRRVPLQRKTDVACYKGAQGAFRCNDRAAALDCAPGRFLALGIDITDSKRFLGHESIATTRLYAETTAAILQRRFDQLTDPAAHALSD